MSKYKNTLRNLANKSKNFNVINMNRGGANKVRLVYKKNPKNTYVNVNVPWNNEPGTLYISHGRTHPNLRRKGLGTRMRALVTLAAKLAGYNRMRQISIYKNNNQKWQSTPPSSRIMNRLGFRKSGNFNNKNTISYVFNFKNMNNSKLKNAIRSRNKN